MEETGSSRHLPGRGPEVHASARSDVMGEAPPARLLIADDHGLMRAGMRAMLTREPDLEVVGEAKDGREAVELCRSLRPDLVLMDISMPEMDGISATRAIKAGSPQIGVLVLTAHDDHDLLLDAIRAGAAGYVLKGVGPAELVGAVRATLAGESPVDHELLMRLVRRLADEDGKEPLKDPDTGPNRLQNYPEITSATTFGGLHLHKREAQQHPQHQKEDEDLHHPVLLQPPRAC